MALKEKLKIESTPIFVFLIFYIIAAIGNLYILATNDFAMVDTAMIAILSLITAYGLYRMERWSLWLIVILFFIGNTFGFVTLYNDIAENGFAGSINTLLLNLALIGYLIMTWLATIYIGARRDKLK